MDDIIKKILTDLYQIDPSLQTKEAQLTKIIKSLLAAKPAVEINAQWQAKLKTELLEQFSVKANKNNNFNLNFMNKLLYGLGGAVLVLILAIPLYFYQTPNKLSPLSWVPNTKLANLDLGFSVTKVDDGAFGSLTASSMPVGEEALSSSLSGRGGFGGGSGVMAPSAAPVAEGDVKIMPPYYQPISYNYVYTGDTFSVDQEQMPVYKRQKGFNQSSNVFNDLNLGLINLGSFNNTKLQNFTLVQDETDGYYITIDLNEGMVSVSENWNRWYTMDQPYESLKPGEVPADGEIIKIADEFLAKHGINLENYGPGEVDNAWRVYYESSPDKANYFIAPNFTVVYPLNINGQTIYDQSGNKDGLRVNVNIQKNKAAGAYGIYSQKYLSSNYSVENNVDKIMELAKQGGVYPEYRDPNAKIVDVELGTPTLIYIKSWTWQNNLSEEILSPALLFPVTKKPANDEYNYFWRQNIVVPLVKEIFEQNYVGTPIPLMEKTTPAEPVAE